MDVTAERPITHRRESVREQNQRIELAQLRADVGAFCDFLEPRLDRLAGVTYELGPDAYQLVASSQLLVARLRVRATR